MNPHTTLHESRQRAVETFTAVVAELVSRGIDASYEYPGWIQILLPDGSVGRAHTLSGWMRDPGGIKMPIRGGKGRFLAAGTANGTWSIDHWDLDGEVLESEESIIPEDCTDVKRIADHLACAYTTYAEAAKEGK